MILPNYDWKKLAAQVADKDSVERAFMDQAYGFLANKAGKLMQDPYKLGFEVVYKNDADTRMVGIFAFRVNNQIMYAPVFFLNGEIKGTDLLYLQETKMFKPLNEEWVSFLIEKNNYEPGMPIDKSQFTRVNNHVRFEDIAYPPNYKRDKSASADCIQTLGDIEILIQKSSFYKEAETQKAATTELPPRKPGELIRQFIEEDGGMDTINKIASWLEKSVPFAEALVASIKEEDYLPANVKKAAAKPADEPALVLFTGRLGKTAHTHLLKQAAKDETKDPDKNPSSNKYADKFFSQGYTLWDDRAPKDIVPVHKDDTEQMELVGTPGMYDVLLRDGTFRQAIVAPASSDDISSIKYNSGSSSCCMPMACGSSPSWSTTNNTYNQGGVIENIAYGSPSMYGITRRVICFTDGSKESDNREQVYGKFIKDQAQLLRDGDLEKTPSTGKAYRVFDAKTGTITDAFYIKSIKDNDGVKSYTVATEGYNSEFTILTQNPDFVENEIKIGFLGSDVYFIPVGTEKFSTDTEGSTTTHRFYSERLKSPDIGNMNTLSDWAKEYVKKATLLHDVESDTFSMRFGHLDQTPYASRINMAVKMASAGFHADAVEEMLDCTKAAGESNWFYGDPMEKNAFPTMQLRDAIFRTEHNRDFGVQQQNPQSFVLRTKTDSRQGPPQLVGDAYDPGMGRKPEDGMSKEQLTSMSPDQIAQYASEKQLPNVFEHGLVGTLTQVYDSLAMIDKYLPDMENALDRLGRILFLFFWKPRDFEDAYGSDDMSNLENQLLSNFKSFGSLTLDLLKRSNKRKLGNVSLSSN
jgi:hypothetical protein